MLPLEQVKGVNITAWCVTEGNSAESQDQVLSAAREGLSYLLLPSATSSAHL